MAKKRFWIGSHGPYSYDDDEKVNDSEGVIDENQAGIVAEGSITALEGVTDSIGIARLRARSYPGDPKIGNGYFWLDLNFNLWFVLKDPLKNIRKHKLTTIGLDLGAENLNIESEIFDPYISHVDSRYRFDNVESEIQITDISISRLRAFKFNDVISESEVTDILENKFEVINILANTEIQNVFLQRIQNIIISSISANTEITKPSLGVV